MANIFEVLKIFGDMGQSGGWPVYKKNKYPKKLEINNEHPPIVIWRYKNANEKLRVDLGKCISQFQGEFEWILECGKGKNWALKPKYIDEITEKMQFLGGRDAAIYLMEAEPEFGRKANAELSYLADHILETMTILGYLKD